MHVRSKILLAAFTATALSAAGCGTGSNSTGGTDLAQKPTAENLDVGSPLYPPKPDVKPPAATVSGGDPLVIPNCNAQFEERQQVSAEVDGKIELLAVRDDAIDPKDPNCVYHPRDVNRQVKYRMLKEGDTVKAKQIICSLDDQLVTTRKESARQSMEAAKSVEASATEGVGYARKKLDLTLKAIAQGGGSPKDELDDRLTLTRFEENKAQAIQSYAKADADFKESEQMLRKHHMTSAVNGIIRTISHRAGEFVKAGDKILEIQATDVVRLEGTLDVQFAAFVHRGMPVTVEPAVPSPPFKSHSLHRNEVTGVAVTADPSRPLVVSTSADGSVRVWDVTRGSTAGNLPHAVPVRCVAVSPAGVKAVVAVTGADDGKVRVWDLSNPDKLPATGRELADTHATAVGAVAFSPDGKFFATAAGREVFIWDAAEGKKLYALPAEHRDAITCLSFTPQATLVTAARDRSLKVWKLGADRAVATMTIDHRAGAVDVLGVTSDGGRVVFDQDKTRLDLVSLADRQTTGQIQNLGATAAFSTLAVFSPNDSLLLTAGGEGELKGGIQVWTVPAAGGRGAEAARLFTPTRAAVTAAAFSPSKEHPFLVVGTDKGSVHLWKPPAAGRKAYTGRVVNVDATDPRHVNVRVELDNKELKLLDRTTATVIINPAQ